MAMRESRADDAGDDEPLADLRVRPTARSQVRAQEARLVGVESADRGRRREQGDASAIVLIHGTDTFRFAVPDQPHLRSDDGA